MSLFVVGIAVTELAARDHQHHRSAIEEADHVGLIYYLAEGASPEQVIERANDKLVELLHLRGCRYEAGQSDRQGAQLDQDGDAHVGTVHGGSRRTGLPGNAVELQVQSLGRTLGRFVFEPTPGWPVTGQRRVVAIAIADQVGAALALRARSA